LPQRQKADNIRSVELPAIYGGILKRFSFSKKKRLASNKQFEAVLARKLRVADGLLVLYAAENDCGYPRLGVSVGKSCGGAVQRNRLKRLLREAFRLSQDCIPPGFDYLLMISPQLSKKLNKSINSKKAVEQLQFEQVKASFLALAAAAVGKTG
jgi:ribonuclease P protein component